MKITSVRTIALGGATHDHGWPGGTDPNVQYNTLVEVIGEDGFVGIGSCYTTLHLDREAETRELLGIPETVTQAGLLPVAYTKGTDFKPAARRPVEEITYLDSWKSPI